MDKPLRLRIPSWLTATDHVDKVKKSYERKEFQQKTKEVKDMAEDTALQIKRELHKGFGSLPAAGLKNLQEPLSAAAITRASSSEVTGRSLLESHAKRLRIHEPDQGSPSPSKAAVPQFHPGPASKSAQNFTVAPFSGKAAGGVFDLRTTKLAMHRAWQKEIGQAEKKISGMVVQLGDTLFDALRADAVDEYDTALECLQMALLFLGSEASPVSTADAGYSIVPVKAGASYHNTGFAAFVEHIVPKLHLGGSVEQDDEQADESFASLLRKEAKEESEKDAGEQGFAKDEAKEDDMLWKGSKHLRRFVSSVTDLPVEDVVETLTAADMTLLADSIKALSTEDGLHETTEKYEAQKTRVDQMWNAMKNGKATWPCKSQVQERPREG